jgi:dTDP-4-amino-4,6-dideoxygalactose transaminase
MCRRTASTPSTCSISLGRDQLIAHLRERGIGSVFHYLPLHLSHMGQQFGGCVGDCPVTEDVSQRLVRLPFFNDPSETDQDRMIAAIHELDG